MKVLLDHCVPREFGRRVDGHEAIHTSQVEMAALANGVLLRTAAAAGFEVLITVDRNMAEQQPLEELPLPVVVIVVVHNKDSVLAPHVPALLSLLAQKLQKRVYVIGEVQRTGRRS